MLKLHKTCERHFMTPSRKQSCDYCEHKSKERCINKRNWRKAIISDIILGRYHIMAKKVSNNKTNHNDVYKRAEQL